MAVAMLFLAAIEANYSAALYTVLYYDAYTREFRDSMNDPAPNAYVHDAPVQAQPCDASAYALPQLVHIEVDGHRLPAAITYPKDFDPSRKYPVHVDIYGGPDAPQVNERWITPSL